MIPETATTKLALLAQAASDAQALALSAKKRAEDLASKLVQLGNARAGEAEIVKAAAEHEQALDLQQSRYRVWQDQEQMLAKLRSWIAELPPGTKLEAAPAPLLSVTDTPALAIAAIRREIGTLAAEHYTLKIAPAPLDDARAQIRTLVNRLASRGAPRLTTQGGQLVIHGWAPDQQTGSPAFSRITEFAAWLNPDQMIAALKRDLAALPRADDALPLDQRGQRLAELAGRNRFA